MLISKRIVRLLTLSFGLLGLVGCSLTLVGTWMVGARLRQAGEEFFDKVESTAVVVQSRVVKTQERLDAWKITTEDVTQNLKDWAKREAVEAAAVRLDVTQKTERLASALEQADHWLELSESLVELIERALSMADSAGAPTDPAAVDGLIEEMALLRSKLVEATDLVTRIRDRTADKSGMKPLNQRMEQAVELAVRLASSLDAMDWRLDKLANRVARMHEDLRQLRVRTLRRIWLATITVMLLVLWMGAGQVALSLYGWRRKDAVETATICSREDPTRTCNPGKLP